MLAAGRTSGVFQLESSGMTGVCVSLKPQNIEDITALIALYRPGPMESIPKFIACKHDPKKVTYLIPQLEPILSITYGCIVYQEQVIQIFQQLAGYSLGQADMLRRAMSKKKVKDIEREREAFLHGDPARNISGCVANGIDEKAAQEIYEEIYAFANYAFNKAHAAAYAVVAYQTAYFKCHYTKEYMAALLSSVLDSSDKVGEYFNECRECGIKLLPPDVNHSADRFTVEPEGIRFGLVAIKNIGRGLILRMMQERELNGPFVDFQDFCRRMDGMEINKRAVENLIRAGAFDSTGAKRSQLIAVYEKVMDGIAEGNRTNVEGQIDFFGMGAETAQQAALVLPDIPRVHAAGAHGDGKGHDRALPLGPSDGRLPLARPLVRCGRYRPRDGGLCAGGRADDVLRRAKNFTRGRRDREQDEDDKEKYPHGLRDARRWHGSHRNALLHARARAVRKLLTGGTGHLCHGYAVRAR